MHFETKCHEAHFILRKINLAEPIPFAARTKAWVCGRSLSEIAGLNPSRGVDVCLE
jgi:hypothetical protein